MKPTTEQIYKNFSSNLLYAVKQTLSLLKDKTPEGFKEAFFAFCKEKDLPLLDDIFITEIEGDKLVLLIVKEKTHALEKIQVSKRDYKRICTMIEEELNVNICDLLFECIDVSLDPFLYDLDDEEDYIFVTADKKRAVIINYDDEYVAYGSFEFIIDCKVGDDWYKKELYVWHPLPYNPYEDKKKLAKKYFKQFIHHKYLLF